MVDAWRSDPPQHISVKQGNAYDKYEILEEIGTGAFGVVHRCIEKSTGRVFAAKFVNAYNAAEKETVCKEVLSLLPHYTLSGSGSGYDDVRITASFAH